LHVNLVEAAFASPRARWAVRFLLLDFVVAAEAATGMPAVTRPAAAAPMSTMRFKLSPEMR
jgi:hypothetical protein